MTKYTEICGEAEGFQGRSPDADDTTACNDIIRYFIDGITITFHNISLKN